MSRTVAIANQKGGVGKTTTVCSLGRAFVEHGLRVLLIDLDAQACLTFSLGVDAEQVEVSAYDVLTGAVPLARAVIASSDGLPVVPGGIELAGAELTLLARSGRERLLREALATVRADYDVVLIDCSPSLGVLTLNGLVAADEVVIPVQCEMLSHRGVGQLIDTVADVQQLANPDLVVRGLLPTMFDARTAHSRAVLRDLAGRYGLPVLAPVPRSVRVAEAPALGRSVLQTASSSAGARAYREIAEQLLAAWEQG